MSNIKKIIEKWWNSVKIICEEDKENLKKEIDGFIEEKLERFFNKVPVDKNWMPQWSLGTLKSEIEKDIIGGTS